MELPNHFTDEELIEIIDSSQFILSLSTKSHRYDLTCGLVLLCLTGIHRLEKRSKFRRKVINNKEQEDEKTKFERLLYKVVNYYVKSIDSTIWTIDNIHIAGQELHAKSKFLSPKFQKLLYQQPLLLNNNDINSDDFIERRSKHQILYFSRDFLLVVAEYHDKLRRPEGTFELDESSDQMEFLSKFDRDTCSKCNQRRAIYCGECFGLRMENVKNLLPTRVSLPFDVLVIKHFAESYKCCTGVHAAVLGKEVNKIM